MNKVNESNYIGLSPKHGAKIRSRLKRIEATECEVWTGAVTSKGYGNITFTIDGKKRWVAAHRALYTIEKGSAGQSELDHLCRNRLCCNPDHLQPVTSAENTARGNSFAAVNARKTHCKRGHEFTEENTWRSPTTGRRKCRTCQAARKRGLL